MRFGKIDISEKLNKMTFANFKKYFARYENRINEGPESVFKKLGGKVPTKRKKTKGGN